MIKIFQGYILSENESYDSIKGKLDSYSPITQDSRNYKNWIANLDLKTCLECRGHHGKIYAMDEIADVQPPLHPNCRCVIKPMKSVEAGNATKDDKMGADYWMKYFARLPDYYITEDELSALGWKRGKSPDKFAPGKMATMGIYTNKDNHLPQIPGRIWYEADINYYDGKRNKHRLLWSNDGLLFVTYDHYETFLEII